MANLKLNAFDIHKKYFFSKKPKTRHSHAIAVSECCRENIENIIVDVHLDLDNET